MECLLCQTSDALSASEFHRRNRRQGKRERKKREKDHCHPFLTSSWPSVTLTRYQVGSSRHNAKERERWGETERDCNSAPLVAIRPFFPKGLGHDDMISMLMALVCYRKTQTQRERERERERERDRERDRDRERERERGQREKSKRARDSGCSKPWASSVVPTRSTCLSRSAHESAWDLLVNNTDFIFPVSHQHCDEYSRQRRLAKSSFFQPKPRA